MALLKVFFFIFFPQLCILSADHDSPFAGMWEEDIIDVIQPFESLSLGETATNSLLPRIRVQGDSDGNLWCSYTSPSLDYFPDNLKDSFRRNWFPSAEIRERLFIQATHKDHVQRGFASRTFINLVLEQNAWAIETLYLTNIVNDHYPFMVADVLVKLVLGENLDGMIILNHLALNQNQAAYLVDMMITDLIKDDALKLWYHRSIKGKLYPAKILSEVRS